MNCNFTYCDTGNSNRETSEFLAIIPPGISDTDSLFNALFNEIQLPGYFGFNWNALSDCLRDLSWIQHRRVLIRHSDLPGIPADDLRIYLEVLCECMSSWKPDEEHELSVMFPCHVQSKIETAMRVKH